MNNDNNIKENSTISHDDMTDKSNIANNSDNNQQDSESLNSSNSTTNQNSAELSNSFAMVNAEQSATIFRQFTQGKVITKQIYNELNSEQQDNPLFTSLFTNESHFKHLYQHLGYQLCLNNEGDFYYVREYREESSDEADDNALKVQTILLQLGRFYSQTGRDLEQLCQVAFGFNEADLSALAKDDDSLAILKAIKVDSWPKAIDFIVSRNFAYKTGANRYFISSAGKAFLFNLVEQYSQFEQS
ncbi:MAG: hypothetical protein V5789_12830 [Colwellia sp.]